jgi:hypothetical protein
MKNKRNAFIALCDHASDNNWCWKIFCTTCGHFGFRVAFSKMIRGHHPDEESFWPNGKNNSSLLREIKEYNDFRDYEPTIENQIKLTSIVAEAEIEDIQKIAHFPDWLGYLGLVIRHCPSLKAQKIISKSLLPQFLEITEKDKELYSYFSEKRDHDGLITTKDLEKIEIFIHRNQERHPLDCKSS